MYVFNECKGSDFTIYLIHKLNLNIGNGKELLIIGYLKKK